MIVAERPSGIPARKSGDAGQSRGKGILVICDFDGTACGVDMGNMVLNRFAGESWREIDRAYCTDEIGSRAAYLKVASLIRGSKGQMVEYVRSEANLDPYFADFYRFCRGRGYTLKIASDGLDFYIEAILGMYGLSDIEYFSNTATFGLGEGISIAFPHVNNLCGKCGTCKSSIVKDFAARFDQVIYVGDSYSDVCPARAADVVFAKHILYEKCRQNGTTCIRYRNFRDVRDHMAINYLPVKPEL
jgi:2,3-diketo-5-methylthio-1-phosphopentane phosphatase